MVYFCIDSSPVAAVGDGGNCMSSTYTVIQHGDGLESLSSGESNPTSSLTV